MQDLRLVIRDFNTLLDKYRSNECVKVKGKTMIYSLDDDNAIIGILEPLRDMYRTQIHEVLAKSYERTAEDEIRFHCKRVILDILPLLELKINQIEQKLSTIKKRSLRYQKSAQVVEQVENLESLQKKYLLLYDNYYALASFRSYKHFCLYMQKVFGFTLWKDTAEVESGYFYYANKMVIDNDVNFMERQLPTGFGKTVGNAFMISFIFGYNIDDTVLYVCGNDKFTEDIIGSVVSLMTSAEYAQVFPYYQKFECNRDYMFTSCNLKSLKLTISGSKRSTNLRVITKLSNTNGVRAAWLFIDDITQRRDMASLSMHQNDIHSFEHEWFERNYSRDNFKIIASGTTYSTFDILSFLKNEFNYANAVVSPINKYTKISYANYICSNKLAVFVCVPLLDPVTDESTYPEKISTFNARLKREKSYEEYMAMDNQTPLPPADNPFYYKNLREYDVVPNVGESGRTDVCYASLDPKRSGKDYLAMPICCKTDSGYYLIDFLFDQRPMKEQYDKIVEKIIRHKIVNLNIERNTDEGISNYINELLLKRGYTSCKIEDTFNTLQKDRRISESESDIKSQIIFPRFGMYSPSSQMGKALQYVYTYTYTGKNEFDDSIDSLALFAKKYISPPTKQYASFSTFSRN